MELTRTSPEGLLAYITVDRHCCICHSGSRRFGVVEPPRTHSNLPCRPASPFITLVRCGSRRFGTVEPPRTHSQLPFRPASPFITVVRGGLVWLNHPELTRTFPVDRLLHSSQWFEEVRWDRTPPNSLQRSL